VNAHAKSRLTLEPLRTLRSETKGQAGACPDRTRAIPCKVRGGHDTAAEYSNDPPTAASIGFRPHPPWARAAANRPALPL